MAAGMAEKKNPILSYRFSSPHTNGQVSVLGSLSPPMSANCHKKSWCGCQQHNPSKSHCSNIFTQIPPYFFPKYGYNYQMLAGYIVNTVHECSFKDNRLFKKQYWHNCVPTSLSATTTCRLGFLRWEQQVLSLLLGLHLPSCSFSFWMSDFCSSCCITPSLNVVCPINNSWSAINRLGPWMQLIMYPPSFSKH